MFLKDCWQVAAFSTEVGEGLLTRMLCDEPVLLYRAADGHVVAMQDRCPHRYLPLSMGRRQGDTIECGYHGMRFGPDGACRHIPGQAMIPARAKLRTYPTVERYSFVWIWLGDAAKANPDLVPDFHWMISAQWAVAQGYHFIHADYRLLVDNLLDLSHETFVHPETIGTAAVADSPVSVRSVGERTICAHRDMLAAEPPPQFVALAGFTGPIDRWQSTFYTPPGFCVIEVGAVPAGSQDRAEGFEGRVLNLITPATAESSHYFWGHARNIRLDDDALTDIIRASIVETFNQDKAVLEAQQIESRRVGTIDPGLVLGIDAGPVQGRRLLRAALKAEELAQ